MAENKKGRKVGRSKRNGQAAKYRNEHRFEQNKLARLKDHIRSHGVTAEVLACMRKLEIILYGVPKTDLPVNKPQRSPASAAFHRLSSAATRMSQMRAISLAA